YSFRAVRLRTVLAVSAGSATIQLRCPSMIAVSMLKNPSIEAKDSLSGSGCRMRDGSLNFVRDDVTRSFRGPAIGTAAQWFCRFLTALLVLFLASCRTTNQSLGLPAKFTFEKEHLVVQSDVKLTRNHELMKDLDRLRDEIISLLDLPAQKQPVVVYLFA